MSFRMQQNFSYFEMEEFLFYFRVHQNLVRNISFQKCFVDVTMKPLLAKQLEDQTKGHHVFALELFSGTNRAFIVLFKAQVGQVFYDRDEDVLGIIFLELSGRFDSSSLVRYFFKIVMRIGITTTNSLAFMHLSDQLGFNKYLLFEPDSEFKLFYNKK